MGPNPHEQVCYTLYATSNTVTQAYKSLLKPLNLTYPQFVVMMALWQRDEVSVSTLASYIGLSKSTMTPLLKRLESQGYISRAYNIEDERQKCISLTDTGKALVSKGTSVAKAALCATGLSDQEVTSLLSICHKIKTELA